MVHPVVSSLRVIVPLTELAELHTSEIADGYDWGRLNLQSVTEESSFQEFLSTAELAETDFQAEKLNITFVNPKSGVGLLSGDERDSVKKKHDSNIELLGIPRRPPWNANTTPEELQAAEREEFLKWRRQLAQLQEVEGLLLTPYEKNLEFWRQLWRVVERSDVVVQIVDARNPLLFRCKDLERYVLEVSPNKQNLILANKADFLTQSQRNAWASYFSEQGVRIAFFSALEAAEEEKARLEAETSESEDVEKEDSSDDDDEKEENKTNELHQNTRVPTDSSGNDSMEENISKISSQTQKTTLSSDESAQIQPASLDSDTAKPTCVNESNSSLTDKKDKAPSHDQHTYDNKTPNSMGNSSKLLTRSELITFFRTLHTGPKVSQGMTTIGLVGYPNVGKSSTINTLLMDKKVSVSATPGKTKHFQTLFLQQDLLLCDCPGLVMPSFLFTKAEMVVNGILPIDQMRDHVPPVTLVASLIPRHILEDRYGIMLPAPLEGEDPLRPPTAEELLNAYGYNRGFMTQNGQPDNPRAARYILKDFVNGKLLYCHGTPGCDQSQYHVYPERSTDNQPRELPPAAKRFNKSHKVTTEDLDKAFFHKNVHSVHQKGMTVLGTRSTISNDGSITGSTLSLAQQSKPWKNHKDKRNKKEKLRRVYSHLDNQ
uniref:Large subunit GTPase 1 homolog n=1 Tax=Timema douglasi TaxID=61478 RepID=A0A7R8VL48_TIMDO|nr:unnamed protein product [Timema douglasi]